MSSRDVLFRCKLCNREQYRSPNSRLCQISTCGGELKRIPTNAELRAKIDELEAQKVKMAKDRDDLRNMISEYESICESFDAGLDAMEVGLDQLRSALDHFSEFV